MVKKKKIEVKKSRYILIVSMLSVLFIGLTGRLYYIMEITGPKLKAIATAQQESELAIPAKRGRILDRNDTELAISESIYRVDLDLVTIRQTLATGKITSSKLATDLASILNMKPTDVTKKLNSTLKNGLPSSSAMLKRQIEKPQIDEINKLNILGIVVSPDTKRYYTNGDFLSSVLGFVNSDGKGASGIELSYNKLLSGTAGRMIYEKDKNNNALPFDDPAYLKPVDGKDVVLSIDENIQELAENAAEKALKSTNAKGVNIIVMNPKNGEILAMANKPSFDLNNPQGTLSSNASVQDNFEPGSIFKVITAACALESNIGVNDSYIDRGTINIDGTVIHDWDAYDGVESFVDIIKNSSNVGFSQLGIKLGKDRLVSFDAKMGIGKKTGIDLPGESSGLLRNSTKMNNVDLATLAFGQGVAVNQVQYMAAFNAIANGGTWVRPHLMKSVVDFDDNNNLHVDQVYNDYGNKKVYDTTLAATLRQDLVKVVTDGVGKNAFVAGLDIAGKTGTAEMADPKTGKYAPNKYMSSFAGMAPASDPKITLLVSIDQPQGSNYYGGEISAPVAKDLFTQIFNYIAYKGEDSVLR